MIPRLLVVSLSFVAVVAFAGLSLGSELELTTTFAAPSPSPSPKKKADPTSEFDLDRVGGFENVSVSLVTRARNIALELANELPNFIAEQSIVRYAKRAGDESRYVIDKLRGNLYTSEEVGQDNTVSQVEEFRLTEYDDGVRWVGNPALSARGQVVTPAELNEKFNRSNGLRALGIYSKAMLLPFAEPANLKILGMREVTRPGKAGGKRMASAYSFDTAPQKLFIIEQSGVKTALPVRGTVYIDSEKAPEGAGKLATQGYVLKIELEAYGFPADSRTQYSKQLIDFAWTRIEGLKRSNADIQELYWLPRAAIVALGRSPEDYGLNEMLFEKYMIFATDVKVLDEETPTKN